MGSFLFQIQLITVRDTYIVFRLKRKFMMSEKVYDFSNIFWGRIWEYCVCFAVGIGFYSRAISYKLLVSLRLFICF